ncbi:MAG: hypothetical protein BGO03_09480 [Mesorhizobium sp. 61-13]|nr:PLP-dependent aminotransferase family protein [Mesorhizobium sp.]OJU50091.1 MAG: hypothetical protein BGO03_09480 [Mesorhizobium sp. 61-13]
MTYEEWIPQLSENGDPIYRRIVSAIVDDIAQQRLRPGMRMPAHRELADQLNINVGTVTRAYTLAREMGLLSGEIGRGTFINAPSPTEHAVDGGPAVIDLMINKPPALDDGASLRKALSQIAEGFSVTQFLEYPPSNGQERHRLAATKLAQMTGVEASVDQVVLSNGAQQALMAAVSSCVAPGGVLATEVLNYVGIRRLAEFLRLRIAAVAIDEHGMLPDSFERICRSEKVSVLVVTPSIHNPTTATLSLERRREIVRIAGHYGVPIVENDIYGALIEKPDPALFTMAETPCWYICGLSKAVNSGIRVGYAIAPAESIGQAMSAIHASTWTVAPLMLEIASQWIFDGTVARMIAGHRVAVAERQKLAKEILGETSFHAHPQSYHIWLPLPLRWRPHEFVEACLKNGAAVTSGAHFQTSPSYVQNAVRVSLGAEPDIEVLRIGLERLRQTLQAPLSLDAMII